MFTEPISITVATVAQSLVRILNQGLTSTYQKADKSFKLFIGHTEKKPGGKPRLTHQVRLEQRKLVTSPIDSSTDYDTAFVSFLIDRPEYGWTDTEVDNIVQALKAWLTTANVQKLYAEES